MTLERDIQAWRESRWPKPDPPEPWEAIKICEEAGEVAGAVTKIAEGRATKEALRDEMGDLLIAMSSLAGRHNWTLKSLLAQRWAEVQQR